MKHIGFTGTRNGMTDEQRRGVEQAVCDIIGGDYELRVAAHHGDCVGADEQFHDIAEQFGCVMIGHPSTHGARGYKRFHLEHDRIAPLERNQVIVNNSDVMIAAPREFAEELRSGTWATVRRTRKANKPLVIVWPNGKSTYERWPDADLESAVQ
jgi:hypothetical protein